MDLLHVPLLILARDLYRKPRNLERFREYLRNIVGAGPDDLIAPMVALNPMARPHVAERHDGLLALDAEAIAAAAVEEARPRVADLPGGLYRVGLTLGDDLGGGWTDRWDYEYAGRFGDERPARRGWAREQSETGEARVGRRGWIAAMLRAGDPPSPAAVREAVVLPIYRIADVHRHGPAQTLRQRMAQEGRIMREARCIGPTLDPTTSPTPAR